MSQGLGGMKRPAKMGLGRGLSALISTQTAAPLAVVAGKEPASNTDTTEVHNVQTATVAAEQGSVTYLRISDIEANPEQPRTHFSEQEISELSESIKSLGVLQPILVRPRDGKYQIVAGERRFRAATLANLAQIPVIIRDLSEREALEIALVENVQRQGLNPVEEAQGYQRLMEDFSLTAQEVAKQVGKDRATVSNIARLLKLPAVVQEMLKDGRLSTGHAKAILTVKEPVAQIGLANKIIAESLSVRQIEAIVSREVVLDAPKKGSNEETLSHQPRSRESIYPELEERLRNALGTKVTIRRNRKGGAIELHFFSDEELDRLIQILG